METMLTQMSLQLAVGALEAERTVSGSGRPQFRR